MGKPPNEMGNCPFAPPPGCATGPNSDECESDNEHEGEQQTPSTSKKHRVENNNIVLSEDELKE